MARDANAGVIVARAVRPLTDPELAQAEKADRALKIKQQLEDAADSHLEAMAERGEPESREVLVRLRRMLNEGGMEATAAALNGVGGGTVEQPTPERPTEASPAPQRPSAQRPDPRVNEDRARRLAFELMKKFWHKWRVTAGKRGFDTAFRELAMDIGDDGVTFIEAGFFPDMLVLITAIQKCLAQDKTTPEDGTKDYVAEIEKMKADLRGEK